MRDPGRYGLAGMGAPAAWQGCGRGPRQGMGSEVFGEFNQAAPCGASLPFGPGKVAGGGGAEWWGVRVCLW